jgi:hypothetical protein
VLTKDYKYNDSDALRSRALMAVTASRGIGPAIRAFAPRQGDLLDWDEQVAEPGMLALGDVEALMSAEGKPSPRLAAVAISRVAA